MTGKFAAALAKNALPKRLGDVQLVYETSMWVGRADKPARTVLANLSLIAGISFGIAALGALLTHAGDGLVAGLMVPCVVGFLAAGWLEQRDRRQRAFAADFAEQVLRLDFSTPIGGMPRTLRIAFDQVRGLELEEQGGGRRVLTVDFEAGRGLYREVLIADVAVGELADAERVRRMLRAAVGLEKPKDDEKAPEEPPPVVDTFG